MGLVGGFPQYDEVPDSIECHPDIDMVRPAWYPHRTFYDGSDSGIEARKGFGMLDLCENQLAIHRYLEEHWDTLSKSYDPWDEKNPRAAVWIVSPLDEET